MSETAEKQTETTEKETKKNEPKKAARQSKTPARAREKPNEAHDTASEAHDKASEAHDKASEAHDKASAADEKPDAAKKRLNAARKKTARDGNEPTESLELLSARNVAKRLPEIADSMAQAAVEGNTTAARVCLDILSRQPKAEDDNVVYVLTHVESGEEANDAQAD